MVESSPGSDFEMILSDVPKGESNISPLEDQYMVKCRSYGLEYFMKKFYVSKKW